MLGLRDLCLVSTVDNHPQTRLQLSVHSKDTLACERGFPPAAKVPIPTLHSMLSISRTDASSQCAQKNSGKLRMKRQRTDCALRDIPIVCICTFHRGVLDTSRRPKPKSNIIAQGACMDHALGRQRIISSILQPILLRHIQ